MTPRDWDHIEGPLSEDELDEECPRCGRWSLVRVVWRAGATTIQCDGGACTYHREGD